MSRGEAATSGEQQTEPLVVFVHIRKTAGTTIRRIIRGERGRRAPAGGQDDTAAPRTGDNGGGAARSRPVSGGGAEARPGDNGGALRSRRSGIPSCRALR